MKTLLLSAALSCAAMAANATTYKASEPYPAEQATLNGERVYSYPVTLTTTASPLQSLTAFCIDASHDLHLGTSYDYTPASLTTGNALALTGFALTSDQIGEVGYLVHEGFQSIAARGSADAISGYQDAIWATEGNAVTGLSVTQASLSSAYQAAAEGRSYSLAAISTPGGQTLAGAVPEPASWALMIVGVAGVGGVMRRKAKAGLIAGTLLALSAGAANAASLVSAVPEPSTWFTMLLGAAITGAVLRRRRTLATA